MLLWKDALKRPSVSICTLQIDMEATEEGSCGLKLCCDSLVVRGSEGGLQPWLLVCAVCVGKDLWAELGHCALLSECMQRDSVVPAVAYSKLQWTQRPKVQLSESWDDD